jgi:hypothetical protein
MPFVTLRRVSVANVAPATGYTVDVDQYDTQARRVYRDRFQSATDPGNVELTAGQLVPGASFCLNQTQRQVVYAGNGTISTHDVPNAPACASSLTGLLLTTTHAGGATGLGTQQRGQITATWSGAAGSVTVRCALIAPGTAETLPFLEVRTLTGTTATFPATLGLPSLVNPTIYDKLARLFTYNPNTGLGPGRYRVEVTEDATGFTLSEEIAVELGPTGITRLYGTPPFAGTIFRVLTDGPLRLVLRSLSLPTFVQEIYLEPAVAGDRLLRLIITTPTPTTANVFAWIYRAGQVLFGQVNLDNATTPSTVQFGDALAPFRYDLPAGTPLAAPPSLGLLVSNGQAGVQATSYAYKQRLELDNLIFFQPPTPTGTGGLIVEVHSSADVDPAANDPLYYRVLDEAGTELQENQTGRFDGLPAGAYQWQVTNGTVTIQQPFTLACAYGKRWAFSFTDEKNGAACRLEKWVLGYSGPVDTLCGDTHDPIQLEAQGLEGGNTQGDLPDSIGSSLSMLLRTAPAELQDVVLDDRACRTDFYYNNGLRFTGYDQPEIYEEPLLSGTIGVKITAACGLASLKDVDFAGHIGQELRGRRPLLTTLLHCLSRTGLSCPLSAYTNRVAAEMTTDDVPELAAYSDRLAYVDDDKPLDLRTVVNAICQALGGTLVQRRGEWHIISALEAAAETSGRIYGPAGASYNLDTLPSPAGRIVPPRIAEKALNLPPYPRAVWHWLEASQVRQRRAGWKFYTGTGDAGFADNALRQGAYFSDADFWDASGTAMRPEAGWRPSPGGFPLSLVEAGASSKEVATLWPYGTNGYLESELAPVEAGREGLPMELSVQAKALGSPDQVASLWVELIAYRTNAGPVSMGAVLNFKTVAGLSEGFTTAKAMVPVGLLTEAFAVRVRVHAYTAFPLRLTPAGGTGTFLLVKSVGVQVLPQGAKWEGESSFVASGPGGSVRPGSPLEVFHVDAPANAGLFRGTAYAFRKTLTYGPVDPLTQWARADDLQLSPLLDSNVLDTMALRANPSLVLSGTVHCLGNPPEPLDAIDAPYDVNGRRFLVGSRTWHVRPARAEVTLIEIGEGEYIAPEPALPDGLRIIDGLTQGQPRYRATERGLRIAVIA